MNPDSGGGVIVLEGRSSSAETKRIFLTGDSAKRKEGWREEYLDQQIYPK